METATARRTEYTTFEPVLHMAFELGEAKWKIGFTTGLGQKPRERTIDGRDLVALEHEIRLAKQRFGLAPETPVKSCYEAGREGFWLHRYLVQKGVANVVVDAASLEVKRRRRRLKTDRVDLEKLCEMLVRYHLGDARVWSVVRVPSVAAEDARQLQRELGALRAERTQHSNRIKGLLTTQGVHLAVHSDFLTRLAAVRLWDGSRVAPGLRDRLGREYARWQVVQEQIRTLEKARHELQEHSTEPAVAMVRQLLRLRGIGEESAWLFVMEFFAWRGFRNRREVGALAGLTPMPHQSGEEAREMGISKSGNRHIRAMAIEIACIWLRYQPDSELSRWYQRRFGKGSKRLHKIGIVAVARKLLIDIWRYLEFDRIPPGAVLKPS